MQRFWETVFDTLTGAAVKGAEVWVFHAADSSVATIYSDSAGALPVSNPLISDGNGYVEAYVADGLYNVEFRFAGISLRTINDVAIFDLSDMRADVDNVLANKLDKSAVSAFGNTLIAEADAASARTLLGVYSTAQVDTGLAAKLDTSAVSAFGQTLIAEVDAPSARGALGVYSTAQVDTSLAAKLNSSAATAFGLSMIGEADAGSLRTLIDAYSKEEVDAAIAAHTTDLTNYYTKAQTDSKIATAANGGTAPTIRGHNSVTFNANTGTVALPAGTVAGDIALLFTGHAYATTKPAGWSVINNPTTIANFMGAALAKVLTAADITAGSVTVNFGGSFNGVIAIVTIVGTTFNHLTPPHGIYADPNDVASYEIFDGGVIPGNLVIGYSAKRTNGIPTLTYDGAAGTVMESLASTNVSFVLSYAIVGGDGKLRLLDGATTWRTGAGSGQCFYLIGCS